MPYFLLYAAIAGLSLTLVTGPLGALVLWRKMAYFGDTLAHGAMLGVAIGVAFKLNLNLAIILCCLFLAGALTLLQQTSKLALDTLLGILAPSSLALSLVLLSFMPNIQADLLLAYLFGDLLAITKTEVWLISASSLLVLILVVCFWRNLLNFCIDADLAKAEGLNIARLQLGLMLLIALVIAIAMKVVGVLLITALLVIPAACAKNLSKTPEQMAIAASVIGNICVIVGLWLSWHFDTPAGPSVVTAASGIFFLSLIFKLLKK